MALDILGLKVPLWVGRMKEKIGVGRLWTLLRSYRLYSARFGYLAGDDDLTSVVAYNTFTTGKCILYHDPIWNKVIAMQVEHEEIDPNGNVVRVDGLGRNNYHKRGLEVGKDCIVLQADSTNLPPLIYIWKMTDEVRMREDILEQQDNMLRKPILVTGVGENFDNMAAKVNAILSGVQFINIKGEGRDKKSNRMDVTETEVLDLQVNNAYKGKELWESRDKFENLIFDYLGYPTVNGDKKERMITDEVNHSSAFARACYTEALKYRKDAVEQFNAISPIQIKLTENILWDAPEDEEEKKDDKEDSLAK